MLQGNLGGYFASISARAAILHGPTAPRVALRSSFSAQSPTAKTLVTDTNSYITFCLACRHRRV
jgi:hypothetical protein